VGTSLGSCYAFLARRTTSGCGCAPSITVRRTSRRGLDGLSTLHVRQSLEGVIDLPTLRRLWMCISRRRTSTSSPLSQEVAVLYTKYDTTFPVGLSEDTIRMAREHKLDHQVVALPCGHYTLGEARSSTSTLQVVSFVLRNL